MSRFAERSIKSKQQQQQKKAEKKKKNTPRIMSLGRRLWIN